jgi:hypothetical protein
VASQRRDLVQMREAVQQDAAGQRALLEGRLADSRTSFAAAAALYRDSWKHAPPTAYGRLVGMLKSAILAGQSEAAARYALGELAGAPRDSPTAAYAEAIAACVVGDDSAVANAAARMYGGSAALDRTADALAALAAGERVAYAHAIERIVADFEQRTEHLTGVPIADTVVMLQRLAEPRGLEARLSSPLLP